MNGKSALEILKRSLICLIVAIYLFVTMVAFYSVLWMNVWIP